MPAVTPDALWVDRVKALTAWEKRPAVTVDQIIVALQGYPLPDADGLTISDDGWTQRWDVNAATAEVWGIKAGSVAGDFNFSADSSRYDKGEVMAHCLAMQAQYAAKVAGSTATHAHTDPLKGVVVNG